MRFESVIQHQQNCAPFLQESESDEDDVFELEELHITEPNLKARKIERKPVDETADKLDTLMELVVGSLSRREAAGELNVMFGTLMRAFEASLLHAYRSKFTQFLLFHVRAPFPQEQQHFACHTSRHYEESCKRKKTDK
jgi:hypothetical protein